MPWVRIDENAMDHPKVAGLSDASFRLWCEGLAFCQKYLTDGALGPTAFRCLRYYTTKRRDELVNAGLWNVTTDGSCEVHDYLAWNDSKETVLSNRESGKRRVALLRDPELRQRIRDRDGDNCRYCGRVVRWQDRKGDLGGTYDHVDPFVGNTYENLVVCCRGCNSSKGKRTPEQAGLTLRPSPRSSSDLNHISPATRGVVCSISSYLKESTAGKILTGDGLAAFDLVRKAYPRKDGNQRAIESEWRLLEPDEAMLQAILADITMRVAGGWADDLQYVPLLGRYLRERKWTEPFVPRKKLAQAFPSGDGRVVPGAEETRRKLAELRTQN